ncbi:Leucine-rich repeat [Carpediemonas membranifera]|uniref:Leucine-rich repeat n=1 Tax=Carpediemonas membranifera TaxID=201153 RepID=A0A8J6B0H4_9EUKA|nr:Leucine-rich repeat [Carpediemonas membranifera]|eukprot:KAG9390299.1 Leucine-rich repeat [Carpediemonas membranifera]
MYVHYVLRNRSHRSNTVSGSTWLRAQERSSEITFMGYASIAKTRTILKNRADARKPDEKGLSRLSDVYKSAEHRHLFQKDKITCVEKMVRRIDMLDAKYKDITTLYLSNNQIRSLTGVEQFLRLETLSLANNRIADLNELRNLSSVPYLRNLNLEGNPVASQPHYRSQAIAHCSTRLAVLDGKQVTDAERKTADAVVRNEASLFRLMLSNQLLIDRLHRAVEKIAMHRQLVAEFKVPGKPLVMTELEPKRIIELAQADLQGSDDSLRDRVRNDMRARAVEVWRKKYPNGLGTRKRPTLTESWDLAYNEVMTLQQKEMSDLLAELDGAKDDIQVFNAKNEARVTSPDGPEAKHRMEREALIGEYQSSVKNLQQTIRGSRVAPHAARSQPVSPKPTPPVQRAWSADVRTAREPGQDLGKTVPPSRLRSLLSHVDVLPDESDAPTASSTTLTQTREVEVPNSPATRIPQPRSRPRGPENSAPNQTNQTAPADTEEELGMLHEALEAAARYQEELETRLEAAFGERDSLRVELDGITRQRGSTAHHLSAVQQACADKEAELAGMRAELIQLRQTAEAATAALGEVTDDRDYHQMKATRFCSELTEMVDMRQKEQRADDHAAVLALRHTLARWRQLPAVSLRAAAVRSMAEERAHSIALAAVGDAFDAWRILPALAQHHRAMATQAEQFHRYRICRAALSCLRTRAAEAEAEEEARLAEADGIRMGVVAAGCLQRWAKFVELRRIKRRNERRACKFERISTTARAFDTWDKAAAKVQRCRAIEQTAVAARNTDTMRASLDLWRAYAAARAQKNAMTARARDVRAGVLLATALGAWHMHHGTYQEAAARARDHTQVEARTVLRTWRVAVETHRAARVQTNAAAVTFCRLERAQAREALHAWRSWACTQRRNRVAVANIEARRTGRAVREAMSQWKTGHLRVLSGQMASVRERTAALAGQIEVTEARYADIEIENLRLIDRLHELNSEVAGLRADQDAVTRAREDQAKDLDAAVLSERDAQLEVEMLRNTNRALTMEVDRLHGVVAERDEVIASHRVISGLEAKTTDDALLDAQSRLADALQQVSALREELSRVEAAADVKVADTVRQLDEAMDVTADLRRVIGDKDAQLRRMTREVDTKEDSIERATLRLEAAQGTIMEEIGSRDRIIDRLAQTATLPDPRPALEMADMRPDNDPNQSRSQARVTTRPADYTMASDSYGAALQSQISSLHEKILSRLRENM